MSSYSVYFANYTIGENAYEEVGTVCAMYGKRALLIGGELALKAGKKRLEDALERSGKTDGQQDQKDTYGNSGKSVWEKPEIVDTVLF